MASYFLYVTFYGFLLTERRPVKICSGLYEGDVIIRL